MLKELSNYLYGKKKPQLQRMERKLPIFLKTDSWYAIVCVMLGNYGTR
jgi:hypothetical protein